MTDKKEKDREDIIKFALGELGKTMKDIKRGKAATVSPNLKKVLQMIKDAAELVDQEKITEEDMEKVVSEAAKQVKKTDPEVK